MRKWPENKCAYLVAAMFWDFFLFVFVFIFLTLGILGHTTTQYNNEGFILGDGGTCLNPSTLEAD